MRFLQTWQKTMGNTVLHALESEICREGRENIQHQPKCIDYQFDSINLYYCYSKYSTANAVKLLEIMNIGSVVKEVRKIVGLDDIKGHFQPN